jgi:glycosyltransferase involved in cell wall biosynthesis
VLVVGDGPLRSALDAHARRVSSPVQLVGASADVPRLLAAADVVVLCSDWEARPLVAQEALRAGVPLVATDVGGVRDLVGRAAVLVPAGDAAALRAAIDRVLADPSLRADLSAAGPQQAATWPTAEAMISRIEQIYLDLTSR